MKKILKMIIKFWFYDDRTSTQKEAWKEYQDTKARMLEYLIRMK